MPSDAHGADRAAVIDLGSNTFRMVVFRDSGGSWERELDLARAVRVGEGLAQTGRLSENAMQRALDALAEFAAACRSNGLTGAGVDAVATSAIRDADNGAQLLGAIRERIGLEVRVLSREQEARYAYLAAVNSTALTDGCVLDLGGGSLQLVRVAGRLARESGSWRMGALRMTERFLAEEGPADRERMRALSEHVAQKLAGARWLAEAGRGGALVGLGGTVRTLAAAAQRAAGLPEQVHGFTLSAEALQELIGRLAALPAAERGNVPGIKAARGDIVLAGALVVQGAMLAGGFQALEATGAGLREGVFHERQLDRPRVLGPAGVR